MAQERIPTPKLDNTTIIRRAFEQAVNQGNMLTIDEFFAWQPAENKQSLSKMRHDFPDLHVIIEDMIAEEYKVATRETWRATHAATGKRVEGTVLHIFWIADGRVINEWGAGWEWRAQFE